MTIHDEKYIVIKREAWDKALIDQANAGLTPAMGEVLNDLATGVVDDAVVIRRQDVFAPEALATYANSILTAIAVALDVSGHIGGVDDEPPTVQRLRRIADYFHTQSELSYADSQRKIPD